MECQEDNGVEALQMVVTRTSHSQFFVQILQLYQLKLMDTSVLIAMVASIR